MHTKTVLIITDNLPDQINGVVTTYKNIEACALLDGYRFVYLDPGWFNFVDCPRYNEVKIAYPRKIGEKIKEISPDYIHIATEGPLGLFARLYLDRNNLRYNTAYHTRFPEGIRKILGIPEWMTWLYIKWFHKHTGKILTTTKTMVEELEQKGLRGNIVSWTRGVDRQIFYPRPKKLLENPKILMCVSRVSKEKNLEEFFKLKIPNTRKIMVGDGPMRYEYQADYPDVEFVGFKKGDELAAYYSMADAFVFPSRWETFGIVMIEAMACGAPVAAYPCPGPLDVVDEGVTGCLNENLEQAVHDALKLERQHVFECSQRWSWPHAWQIFKDNLTAIS